MQRASLRRLVAWVIAQADGQQLGHNDADERDSSRAQFVVRQSGERGRDRNKGGIKTSSSQGCVQDFITRETR